MMGLLAPSESTPVGASLCRVGVACAEPCARDSLSPLPALWYMLVDGLDEVLPGRGGIEGVG